MGHHIRADGKFQSDRHPQLDPDKIVLSFKDPTAIRALHKYAMETPDRELAQDIRARCMSMIEEKRAAGEWLSEPFNLY